MMRTSEIGTLAARRMVNNPYAARVTGLWVSHTK
jgi:hypothetical protein